MLRVELMKLPLYQDAMLAVGTAATTGAGVTTGVGGGGGVSTDAPPAAAATATATTAATATATSAAVTSTEMDPAEGCGIGSSNKPLYLLKSLDPTVHKALESEIDRLDEELLTWMGQYCVETNPNATIMFFKAYDPNNILPSRIW